MGDRGSHAASPPDACSVLWDRAATSAYGTAAVARFFVALEQPGPWGRNALRESHLGPRLGGELELRCSDRGGRFVLLRRPGEHPDTGGPVTVLVAHAGGRSTGAWLLRATVDTAERLLDLDWESLSLGDQDGVARSLPGATAAAPALLVCTNGRRDVCCAVRGRPVAAAAAAHAPERVWESSHTGGHRFAPTGVLLPWGQTYARLTESLAADILDAGTHGRTPAGALGPLHDRGRSLHAPEVQCAESNVRATLGEERLEALWAEPVPEARTEALDASPCPAGDDASARDVLVRHADGGRWIVTVSRVDTGEARAESCGKDPVPVRVHEATTVRELPPERSGT